jgi:hypothetical protein
MKKPGSATGEFDFWVGTWRGSWDGEDGTSTARNTITKEYGGHVIVERFETDPPGTFDGLSLSVYDPLERCWKQTWVDDDGAYLEFRGGLRDGVMVLARQFLDEDLVVSQRMVWRSIEPASFEWLWERSTQGGSWQTLMLQHWQRSDSADPQAPS